MILCVCVSLYVLEERREREIEGERVKEKRFNDFFAGYFDFVLLCFFFHFTLKGYKIYAFHIFGEAIAGMLKYTE